MHLVYNKNGNGNISLLQQIFKNIQKIFFFNLKISFHLEFQGNYYMKDINNLNYLPKKMIKNNFIKKADIIKKGIKKLQVSRLMNFWIYFANYFKRCKN